MRRITTTPAAAMVITAAPKNHIQRLKIDDNTLKLVIYKYEALIPWQNIKTKDDLVNHIRQNMIPQIKSLIDPTAEVNQYLKEINVEKEYRNNPNDELTKQAYETYKSGDVEGAKQSLLDAFNSQKKDAFGSWSQYLEENYAEQPGFIYSVLKPIIESSDEKTKETPTTLNAEGLAGVFTSVQNGQVDVNLLRSYKSIVSAIDRKGRKVVQTGNDQGEDGWIQLPMQSSKPEEYEDNVQRLTRLSTGNGWCTGRGQAAPYLIQGDFWLYIKSGRAVAAIRMTGKKTMIEIVGHHNRIPYDYSTEVIGLVKKMGFDQNSSPFRHFKEVMQFNESYGKSPEAQNALLYKMRTNPFEINRLLPENLSPELLEKSVPYFVNYLRNDCTKFTLVPKAIRNREEIIQAAVDGITPTIKNASSTLNNETPDLPTILDGFAPEILKHPQAEQLIENALSERFIAKPPTKEIWNLLSDRVKQSKMVVQSLIRSIPLHIGKDPQYYYKVPEEFSSIPQVKQAMDSAFAEGYLLVLRTTPTNKTWNESPAFARDEKGKQAIIQGAPEYVKRENTAEAFANVPDFAKESPAMQEIALKMFPVWLKESKNIRFVPHNLLGNPAIQQAFESNLLNYITKFPNHLYELPKETWNRPDVLQAWVPAMVRYMSSESTSASVYSTLTKEHQQIPQIKQAYLVKAATSQLWSKDLSWRIPREILNDPAFIKYAGDNAIRMLNARENPEQVFKGFPVIIRDIPAVRDELLRLTNRRGTLGPKTPLPANPKELMERVRQSNPLRPPMNRKPQLPPVNPQVEQIDQPVQPPAPQRPMQAGKIITLYTVKRG